MTPAGARLVATAIAFLASLSRSVENVPGLGGGTPVATPRRSIGWWFIPFANLFKPFQVVGDLYRRMALVERVGTAIVTAWWLLWILSNMSSRIATGLGRSRDIDGLRSSLQFVMIGDALSAAAAVLAVVIVRRIQGWADRRASAVRAATPSDGEPSPQTIVVSA